MHKYFLALVILISVNIYSENLNNKIITAKEIVTLEPAYKNIEAIYIRNNCSKYSGSIAPGKNSNFTILSANPLTIDSIDI